MSDHNVILCVGAYSSGSIARHDCIALSRTTERGTRQAMAAARVSKGSGGALSLAEEDWPSPRKPLECALLGAALTVVATPVGIAYLPPVVATPDGWTIVRQFVVHFWEQIPQETLRVMSDMLESNPAGIVLVAVDQTPAAVRGLLPHASSVVVAESIPLGSDSVLWAIDQAIGP